MSQLYLVKDKKGRIFGPYTEEEICFHIEEGELKGNELFSNYPTGKWQALSASSVFYKKIISQLNRSEKTAHTRDEMSALSDNVTAEEKETLEPTRILKVDLKESSSQKKKVKIKLSREFRDEVLEDEGFKDVIDMEPLDSKKKPPYQKLVRYALFAGASFILLMVFMLAPSGDKSESLKPERLLAPYKTGAEMTRQELKKRMGITLDIYKKSSIESYLKAQKSYVSLLESFPEESSIYPLLCLVQLELWPFSYQDTRDRQSLQKTLNAIQKQDQEPAKKDSRFCLAAHSFIKKDFKGAFKMADHLVKIIQNADSAKKPEKPKTPKKPNKKIKSPVSLPLIYYLQAQALKNLNLEKKALSLLNTVISLDPGWIGPRLSKADIYYRSQKYNLAIKEYENILKIFPSHSSALFRLGILQNKHLGQFKKSKETLKRAFSQDSQKTAPDILFEAYLILASIYDSSQKEKDFIKYTKKAYALRPDSPDVIKLKNKIEGRNKDGNEGKDKDEKKNKNREAFKNVRVESRALIYQGDLLMSQGDCLKAVKSFTEAYRFTGSGLAAFKAGQCYWELGNKGQSVRWLKKAMNIDPKLLDAHLALSDYLSQLYQFDYARDILSSVLREYPNNPDVYKAYAKLAFRADFYRQTIAYGGRVLNFYPHDIETFILLSRSHFALQQVNMAYSYAKKAIRQAPNDVSAQISYALILDHAGREEDTETYLRRMIKKSPTAFAYHQALGEHFYNQGEYHKAKEELEALIVKNTKLKDAYMYLGLVYKELGLENKKYYDEAVKQFRSASLLDLSDVKPFFYVGQIYLDSGNYSSALSAFNKVVAANPNYPLIHYYIGLTILNQGGPENLDKALESAKLAVVKSPKSYLPYKLAGDVYRLKTNQSFNDERERAKIHALCAKEYQKALKYVEKSIEISMNLLKCYKGAGHFDLALELAENLTKEEGLSGYPEIYREIGVIFEFKEEYERASSYYETYFQLKPAAKDRVEIKRRIASLIEKKESLTKEPEED